MVRAHLALLKQRRHQPIRHPTVGCALAHSVNTRIGDGLHGVCHHNASVAVNADGLGQLRIGAYTGRHHDEVCGHLAPVFEPDGFDSPIGITHQLLGLSAHPELQATLLQRALQQLPSDLIELPLHQHARDVHNRHGHAPDHQSVGRLQPQQTATDHHGMPVSAGCLDHVVRVGDVAVGNHALQIPPWQRRDERIRARGQQEPVILCLDAIGRGHQAALAIHVHHLLPCVQGDPMIAVPGQRIQHDLVQRLLAGQHR